MITMRQTLKLAPVLVLALFAVGTSVQVGCSGMILRSDDKPVDDGTREDWPEGGIAKCGDYGYRYGYAYGCDGYGGYRR